jgi:hypothetical protein
LASPTKCFRRLREYRRSPQEMSPKHSNLIYRTSEAGPGGSKTYGKTQGMKNVVGRIQE